jgi:AcrR family transcriptional regulator
MATPKTTAKKPAAEGRKRTGLRRALVENEILDRAADLFAERGFKGTSLQDVADALGMSRTALYYYMSSKEAILGRLVENLSGRDAKALEGIRRRNDDPIDRLRAMAREVANNASSNPKQTRILVENRHHLPPDLAETDRKAERTIVKSIESVLEEGIRSGDFRPVETRPAALAIIGMCIWTAWWISPSAGATPDEIADQISDQAVASVRATPDGIDRSDPAHLLRAARESLDQLERVIGK